jgi:hypothetical protein
MTTSSLKVSIESLDSKKEVSQGVIHISKGIPENWQIAPIRLEA